MAIAVTAVTKMMKGSYFSVCTVDAVCNVIGAARSGPAYNMLHALHCVEFGDMPNEVRESIPALLREVFGQPAFDDPAIADIFKGVRA
jgi:hypothetical protein